MKIILLNTRTGWAGGERWFLWAAETLGTRGHEILLATARGSELAFRAHAAGVKIGTVRVGMMLWRDLRRLFSGSAPDVALCNTGGESRAAVLARRRAHRPKVIFRRGLCRPIGAGPLDRWFFRRVDGFLCNSAETLRVVRAACPSLPADRFTVLYNPAPAPDTPSEAVMSEWRARLGVQPGELVVLSVGRLAVEKGHVFLLRAFRRLLEHRPARLFIAGEGPEQASLEAAARDLGIADRVRLCGFVKDLGPLYLLADMLVQPSLPGYESFSNAALEALSYGLPIVATTVGGFPELIEDGADGLLVPPGDADRLAAAMIRLAGNEAERRRMGDAARAGVREKFSSEAKAAELDEYLRRIVSL